MNASKILQHKFAIKAARQMAALLSVFALLSSTFALASNVQRKEKQQSQRLSEEQRIIHVLNRLGFGPRPGDVERVRAIGLDRYIEQQLQPEKIDDSTAAAKLKELQTLSMSNAELLAKFPNPGMLIRQLQEQGKLPPELAPFAKDRKKDNKAAGPMEKSQSEAMTSGKDAGSEASKEDYRKAVAEYMRANNLEPPQRILAELQASRILRAVYSERQLQEVMVDFWTNHFNVFANKGADRWFLTSYDRDAIRPHAMGKFRDLLGATAKSPAMLFYLDNFQSIGPNTRGSRRQEEREQFMRPRNKRFGRASVNDEGLRLGALVNNRRAMRQQQQRDLLGVKDRAAVAAGRMQEMKRQEQMVQKPAQQQKPRRGINENYARELMELHTLGVDGGYTQKDVQEVARAFTGWTIVDPRGRLAGEDAGRFYFNPRLHDDGEKIVLGQKIPAGGGMKDGEIVLDILSRHPSTAKFIATKLSRRFVSDNPSPALVQRVADAFTKSDGDIRQTLRAVFASPEFNSIESHRAKIKTPFELAVSAIRTLGGETNGGPALHQWIARMGEGLYLYQAPTGYPDTAENWVNTGALLERLNFALALVSNRIPGTRVDLTRFAADVAGAGGGKSLDQSRVIDQFANLILQGNVSPKTKETLMKQLNDANTASVTGPATEMNEAANMPEGRKREGRKSYGRGVGRRAMQNADLASVNNPDVARIAALILGTPEFQRQ